MIFRPSCGGRGQEVTFLEKIIDVKIEFIEKYNKQPEKVYLGREQMEEFKQFVVDAHLCVHKTTGLPVGMEVQGLQIFVVDEISHFNVTL